MMHGLVGADCEFRMTRWRHNVQELAPLHIITAHYYLDDVVESIGPTKFIAGRSPSVWPLACPRVLVLIVPVPRPLFSLSLVGAMPRLCTAPLRRPHRSFSLQNALRPDTTPPLPTPRAPMPVI